MPIQSTDKVGAGGGSSGLGYTIQLHTAVVFNPVDSTTYNLGLPMASGLIDNSAGNYDRVKVRIPKTGTLKSIAVNVRVTGTLGSTEAVAHNLRINDTTSVTGPSLTYDAASPRGTTTHSQAVTEGDFVTLQVVAPAFATNPTNVLWHCMLYIE
jgi:hypothetical protein